jgi:hypothetical protein
MAKYVYVDIVHSSGAKEAGHKIELAQHSRRSVAEQIEDHLKVKHCGKNRGGWKYSIVDAPKPAAVVPAPTVPAEQDTVSDA